MSICKISRQEILTLTPPLQFECSVEGKSLLAILTHIEENFIQYIYHVSFTDGYSSGFVQPEGSEWGDMNPETKYVHAIKNDLQAIAHHKFSSHIFYFPYSIEGVKTNVWVLEGHYEWVEVYFVFYKGLHQFTLKKEDDYQIVTLKNSILTEEAKELASEAIERIKALQLNP